MILNCRPLNLGIHRYGWLAALFLFAASLSQLAWGADAPTADQLNLGVETKPSVYYLEDPDGLLDLHAVRDSALKSRWHKTVSTQTNFGYTTSTFWFQLRLANPTRQPLSKLLVVSAPFLDHIEYYLVHNGEVTQTFVTGDRYPFSQRLISHPQFLFPVSFDAGREYSIYFRVQTPGSMEFPVSVWNEREFYLQDSAKTQIHSIYYGILLFVIFFNLFIYLMLKETTYLYYVLFMASILLIQSTLHARTFEHIWPDWPELQNLMILFSVPASIIFSTLFARNFLNLDRHHRWLAGILKTLTGLGILSLLLAFVIPYAYSSRISIMLAVPTSLALLVVGPVLWWRGVAEARFYTIAWAALQFGASSTILYKLGVLPASFITNYGLQLGSAMEAVLLSMAIADRVYRERSDKLQAQHRIIREAEERRHMERRLLEQATHSAVSSLPNRVLFENKVQDLIQNHYDQQFLICLIHLSRFHEIDKTLGHDNADRLLRQMSGDYNGICATLEGIITLEETDLGKRFYLANTEGVTMGLLLRHYGVLQDDERISRLEAETRRRVEFDHLTLDLGAKIGIAHYPFHSLTTSGLIRKAHIALDNASTDQSNVSFYRKELDPYNERRLTLMAELDKAIGQDSLDLHFQPQLDLASNRIIGVETLLRWKHPEYGFIPPDEFVVLAERTGIIAALTRWVIRHTLIARDQVREAGFQTHFSINISAMNLREADFAHQVAQLLRQHEVTPEEITLELTETAMMSNPARALEELSQLSRIGVQLSIDDFGTGYSSLSYIKKLPIDEIKIDKSLIFDLSTQADDQVIVKTTLDMCHNLGYRVVAEGVENQEVLDILRGLGCDLIQGYFLARPMPLPALLDWLGERDGQAGQGLEQLPSGQA